MRVSSGPEIGAYYHEFFLRDKPHLAAQMFCKNARSKLAMSSDTPAPKPPPETVKQAPEPPKQVTPPPPQPVATLPPDIPLALLESLSKGPITEQKGQHTPGRLLQQSQYANLLLERQIQVLQQEQAKLLLVREAVAIQHRQEQAQLAQLHHRQQADEQRLRQLMDIKVQQKQNRGPTNHRASAA